MNVVALSGSLARPPESRLLRSGERLVSYDVTVRDEGRPAETVPVVWFDPPDRALAFGTGDEVVVAGRVRRRFFRAGGATASRTEVVAEAVVPARQRARSARALEQVLAPAVAAAG